MEGALGMHSLTKELADIFEESENDRTFYGFSDSENSDFSKGSDSEGGHEAKPDPTSAKQPVRPFRLRIALRSRSSIHHSTEEEEEEETLERELKKDAKSKRKTLKIERHVKFEEEEKPVAQPFISMSGSGSDGDEYSSFLDKRAQNIKANKAMLAQLMADLQKMPGGGGLLKKQAGKKPKERGPRPPRSSMDRGESRKNPERATRRRTRSMGGGEDSPAPKEELELSLEEELLEVRGAPRRRGTPRPNQSKPHVIRPAEEITEDEIQLVADNMTEKVYNRATGSTCHQCRQKTIDTKTCCRSKDCRGIQGQFCGPCLRNRYGEDVKKALRDPDWQCPPCRGICNCSFCRAREGRCPTGILFPLAQYHGFSDVHSYLSSLRNKLKNGEEDV